MALIHAGTPEHAAGHFLKTLEQHPNDANALHLLSVATFQLGRTADAVAYAERAIAIAGDKPDYHSNLGRYCLAQGNLDAAQCHLRRALEIAPRHPMARYNLASVLHAAGDREAALDETRHYLDLAPNEAIGHHLAATLLSEMGLAEESLPYFRRALELKPAPETHNNLGNALQSLGRSAEAVVQYEQALRLKQDYPEAASNMGAALQSLGHKDDARAWFEQALRMRPGFPPARANLANLAAAGADNRRAVELYRALIAEAPSAETWNNLGNCLQELGETEQALDAYENALRLNPGYFLVHNNIGNLLRRSGRPRDAIAHFERALRRNPRFAEALNNLGVAFADLGRLSEAQSLYEKALEAKPDFPDPWINRGNIHRDAGRPRQALECYRQAALLKPDNAYAWNNLGCALGDQSAVAEAIQCFERAVTLMPANHHAFSNVLLNLHYLETYTPEAIHAAHQEYGARYDGVGAACRRPHTNAPDPGRRLRVGYVSADFRRHSVAYFLEPVIEGHRRSRAIEVFCYSDVARADEVTARFAAIAGPGWRDIRGLSIERFADLVRADGIDLLVDTGGHTANSRLIDFTTRPAPVQVTWLGYPDTTGLASIGYRLTDAVADPPEATEAWHIEKLVHLEGGFLCFRPPADAPEPAPPPSQQGAPFTFGSFNSLSKFSAATISLWAAILKRTPGARLALKNRSLNEGEARRRLLASFAGNGIGEDRIWLSGLIDSLAGHLEAYGLVDIALDTFPYHGTTTTCEALWMGVPVITLTGRTHASRVGASLLSNAGLETLIAANEHDYVNKACALAADGPRLRTLRAGLRPRLSRSPLRDEAAFTEKLENAYRAMWGEWCARQHV